jgi:hypothetical protein
MKVIKYIILYLVPVPLVKKLRFLRFRFHNAGSQMRFRPEIPTPASEPVLPAITGAAGDAAARPSCTSQRMLGKAPLQIPPFRCASVPVSGHL